MEKKAILNVLYQSDSNMQYYMGVSIVSLFKHNEDASINVYVIDIGIEDCFLDELKSFIKKENGRIVVINGNKLRKKEEVREFPIYNGMRRNKSSYLKLFWDISIKEEIDRLIYIDCDTVVVDDISELMGIDLNGRMLGMVCDSLITDETAKIGLSENDKYYNSGVIVFDAVKWRNSDTDRRIIEHAKSHSYGTVDQDLLNIEFKNEIECLPLKYNFQSIHFLVNSNTYCKEFKRKNYYNIKDIESATENKKIVHFLKFIGQNPWDKGNIHPCRKIFEQYLNISPWRGLKKTKRKSNIIYIIEKILYVVLPRGLFIKIFHIAHRARINNSNKVDNNKR